MNEGKHYLSFLESPRTGAVLAAAATGAAISVPASAVAETATATGKSVFTLLNMGSEGTWVNLENCKPAESDVMTCTIQEMVDFDPGSSTGGNVPEEPTKWGHYYVVSYFRRSSAWGGLESLPEKFQRIEFRMRKDGEDVQMGKIKQTPETPISHPTLEKGVPFEEGHLLTWGKGKGNIYIIYDKEIQPDGKITFKVKTKIDLENIFSPEEFDQIRGEGFYKGKLYYKLVEQISYDPKEKTWKVNIKLCIIDVFNGGAKKLYENLPEGIKAQSYDIQLVIDNYPGGPKVLIGGYFFDPEGDFSKPINDQPFDLPYDSKLTFDPNGQYFVAYNDEETIIYSLKDPTQSKKITTKAIIDGEEKEVDLVSVALDWETNDTMIVRSFYHQLKDFDYYKIHRMKVTNLDPIEFEMTQLEVIGATTDPNHLYHQSSVAFGINDDFDEDGINDYEDGLDWKNKFTPPVEPDPEPEPESEEAEEVPELPPEEATEPPPNPEYDNDADAGSIGDGDAIEQPSPEVSEPEDTELDEEGSDSNINDADADDAGIGDTDTGAVDSADDIPVADASEVDTLSSDDIDVFSVDSEGDTSKKPDTNDEDIVGVDSVSGAEIETDVSPPAPSSEQAPPQFSDEGGCMTAQGRGRFETFGDAAPMMFVVGAAIGAAGIARRRRIREILEEIQQ